MQHALLALLAVVPWVAFTLVLRYLVDFQGWSVSLVGTLSRLVTVPLLVAWILSTGAGWRRLRVGGVPGWILLMGAVSIFINLCWFGALQWTNATNVSLLFRIDLVFVVLIGALLGRERIGVAQLALVPLMLLGLALLMEIHEFDFSGHLVGDRMIVAAAIGFAVNAFVIRHILGVLDEETVALYNHAISMLGFLVLGIFTGGLARAPEIFHEPAAWGPVVLLGAIGALGLPLYYAALRRMDIWKLRTFMLSAPLITGAAEWWLWRVTFSAAQYLGAAIILGGLAVLIRIESHARSGRVPAPKAPEPIAPANTPFATAHTPGTAPDSLSDPSLPDPRKDPAA